MSNNFKFSIVMSIYNVDNYIREAIDSIINQTIGFEDNVQLILVNDGSTDKSGEICLEYEKKYPNNIKTITKKNGGLSSSRNCGLKYVEGEYVNFFDPDDILSENTLKHVYKFFKKHNNEIDIVAMPIVMFGKRNGDHILNYKFEKERVIDLSKDYEFILLSAASSFFKKDVIKRYSFKEGLPRGEDALTINKILLEKKKYGVVTGVTYWYRQRFDGTSMLDSAKHKESYFTPYIKECLLDLINYCIKSEGHVPLFIQYAAIYDFRWLASEPELPDFYDDQDKEEFWQTVYEFLSYINDDIIKEHLKLPRYLKVFILYLKNKKDFNIKFNENKVTLHSGNHQLDNLNTHNLWFDIITLKDGFLHISASFKTLCDIKNIRVIAIKNEIGKNKKTEYVGKFFEYPNRKVERYLSINWRFNYTAEFKIPIDSSDISRIKFKINISDDTHDVYFTGRIRFFRPCRISNYNHYYLADNQIVSYQHNSIYCKPYTFERLVKNEIKTFKLLFKRRPKSYVSAALFRIANNLYYPFMKNRRIWLFSDRPTMADDNGKHLFEYSIKQDDEIEKYYVIDKDCPDYKKMLEIDKNIIPRGSFKHKIYFTHAEKIITPFLNEDYTNPFSSAFRLFAGYFTYKFYFLQHGVTKDDISTHVKRYNKDLSLFLTTSDLERDSIFNGNYNYEEDVVQALGFPRFDKLNNENIKKTILFMPTWRDTITNKDELINSQYYHLINSFLNNEKLINTMREYGYKLIFRPHPELLDYLKEGLFDIPEEIIVSTDDPYQDLFNTASLLITDYSSVFFDFAYLKKPIIYYHVNDESYHYKKGYFDYETMGFGVVTHNEEELVDEICESIENDCKNDEEYINRVEKFFKFTDKNNCKRVYEWILEN